MTCHLESLWLIQTENRDLNEWPLTQNPFGFMSTLASFLVFALPLFQVSPVMGNSRGSISTFLQALFSCSILHVECLSLICTYMLMECLLIFIHTFSECYSKSVVCSDRTPHLKQCKTLTSQILLLAIFLTLLTIIYMSSYFY